MSKEKTEKLKDNSDVAGKNGGARPGAGRKKGGENQATKDKRIVQEEIKQRVLKSANTLITSQMTLAEGVQMLYCITTNEDGKRSKPVLVTDPDTIESYLAGDKPDNSDEYHFITTERPDNKAIDSLLDRTFGKARQNIGLGGEEEGSPIVVKEIREIISGKLKDLI